MNVAHPPCVIKTVSNVTQTNLRSHVVRKRKAKRHKCVTTTRCHTGRLGPPQWRLIGRDETTVRPKESHYQDITTTRPAPQPQNCDHNVIRLVSPCITYEDWNDPQSGEGEGRSHLAQKIIQDPSTTNKLLNEASFSSCNTPETSKSIHKPADKPSV